MRLDHLLSREPSFVGNKRVLAGLVGAWLFSCACMCSLPMVGGGCGCVFGLGIKRFSAAVWWWGQASTLSGSRSTPCERPLPVGGGCPHSQPVTVVLLVWVVCGGLFVICIVVASIFVLYCFLCFV